MCDSGLVVLYNAIWSAFVSFRYNPFCEALGSKYALVRCTQRDGDYTYHVKKPNYLSFTGNLAVTPNIIVGSEEEQLGMIIWPKGFDRYKVGIDIQYVTFEGSGYMRTSNSHGILLDENMQFWEGDIYDPEAQKLYKQYEEEIKQLYDLAYRKWGILKLE